MKKEKDLYSPPETDVAGAKKSGRRKLSWKALLFLFIAGFVVAFALTLLFAPGGPLPFTNRP